MALSHNIQDYDRKEGNYWELDGEMQNRCPRVYIRDHDSDWADYMLAYKAFDSGFLPSAGGVDAQPALFMPIMTTLSAAINQEQEVRRQVTTKRREEMDASKKQASLQAANNPTFAKIPPVIKKV